MDIITQYILSLAPAITSIIGIVVALIVGVKKIKRVNLDTENSVKDIKKELEKTKEENKALKTQLEVSNSRLGQVSGELSKINAKLNHIHVKKEE